MFVNKSLCFVLPDKHTVGVESKTVDDGVVTGQILNKLSIWTFPLFDVVRSATMIIEC